MKIMKHLKRMASVLLMLILLLNFGLLATAESVKTTESGLTITTDPESKTVRINSTQSLDDPASLLILSPAFGGDFKNVWGKPSSIVGIDQVAGAVDVTVPLDKVEKGKYTLSLNKDMIVEQFSFFLDSYTVKTGERVTLPITVTDCQKLSGMIGAIDYDEDLLTLESIAPAKDFRLLSQVNRFIALSGDGMGLDGDVVVGYVIFKAKSGLDDDVTTYVDIRVEDAQDEAQQPITICGSTFEVVILGIPPMRGDVNLDEKVDLADAILLLQYLSKNINLTPKQLKAADATGDGVVNTADVIVIMQMSL